MLWSKARLDQLKSVSLLQILTPYRICLCMLLDLSHTEAQYTSDPATIDKVSAALLKKITVRLTELA